MKCISVSYLRQNEQAVSYPAGYCFLENTQERDSAINKSGKRNKPSLGFSAKAKFKNVLLRMLEGQEILLSE